MTLRNLFSDTTLISAIRDGDFGFLTQGGINVGAAKKLINTYFQLPVDKIVEEASKANLIENNGEARFRERIQDAIGDGINYSRMGFRPDRIDDSQFYNRKMVIDEERLNANFYFILGSDDGPIMLGWAENRDDGKSRSTSNNMFDGQYLTVDSSGRIYLKTIKPILTARDVFVDARIAYEDKNEVQAIESAIKMGQQLTKLGLRDPNARPEDSFISGRHYSSMKLLVNHYSNNVLATKDVRGMKQVSGSVLGGSEVEVTSHDLNSLSRGNSLIVILSTRGDSANDSSIFEQISPRLTKEIGDAVKSDPEAAIALTRLLKSLALEK